MKLKTPIVFILGAGFTKAFSKDAPLINVSDMDLGGAKLRKKYSSFKKVRNLFKSFLDIKEEINIENLLSRLYVGMPYDDEALNEGEGVLLYNDIRENFFSLIRNIKIDDDKKDQMQNFARVILESSATCLTFNYDTLLDEALFKVHNNYNATPSEHDYWHPDGGYGFFCKPSFTTIQDQGIFKDRTNTLLLKLHGSINWRIKRGYRKPYSLDAIVHDEDWFEGSGAHDINDDEKNIQLEKFPFIVPPVLIKSELISEPILKNVWSLAFNRLVDAKTIVFIGYSLPKTDIATQFLLKETINNVDRRFKKDIIVVNSKSKKDITEKMRPYFDIFPRLTRDNFAFEGAYEWITKSLL